jgi:hypothetical protein
MCTHVASRECTAGRAWGCTVLCSEHHSANTQSCALLRTQPAHFLQCAWHSVRPWLMHLTSRKRATPSRRLPPQPSPPTPASVADHLLRLFVAAHQTSRPHAPHCSYTAATSQVQTRDAQASLRLHLAASPREAGLQSNRGSNIEAIPEQDVHTNMQHAQEQPA